MKALEVKKVESFPGQRISPPTHAAISCLAYKLLKREGKPEGKHLEHWLNAESMTRNNFGCGRDHADHDFTQTTGDE